MCFSVDKVAICFLNSFCCGHKTKFTDQALQDWQALQRMTLREQRELVTNNRPKSQPTPSQTVV
jgi:hypothetical protein